MTNSLYDNPNDLITNPSNRKDDDGSLLITSSDQGKSQSTFPDPMHFFDNSINLLKPDELSATCQKDDSFKPRTVIHPTLDSSSNDETNPRNNDSIIIIRRIQNLPLDILPQVYYDIIYHP